MTMGLYWFGKNKPKKVWYLFQLLVFILHYTGWILTSETSVTLLYLTFLLIASKFACASKCNIVCELYRKFDLHSNYEVNKSWVLKIINYNSRLTYGTCM